MEQVLKEVMGLAIPGAGRVSGEHILVSFLRR